MFLWSFAFSCFLQLTLAASTNTTTTACPSTDATDCNYRSVWSLLASCGLTLLVCVWHAIHPSVPLPHFKWYHRVVYRLSLMLFAFFTPEVMIAAAVDEWYEAKKILQNAQIRGYTWWTMTHSHFMLNGGFVIYDETGVNEIDVERLLSLMDAGNIVNPIITKDEIRDKSKSDGLGKAILVMQLSWFITQIIVRLLNHLTVTLVELDTVCMALFTVPLIFFWWSKPCCPDRPHIFYKHSSGNEVDVYEMLKKRARPEKLQDNLTINTVRDLGKLLLPGDFDSTGPSFMALVLTWSIFGALHAIAWNYEFPTEIEKTLWRVASLTLVGSPVIFFAMMAVSAAVEDIVGFPDLIHDALLLLDIFLPITGVISRVLLVALMLASLRALPSSAHVIIPWTTYIPHL